MRVTYSPPLRASAEVDLFQRSPDGRIGRRRVSKTSGDRERHCVHRVVHIPRVRSLRELPLAQERRVLDHGLVQCHGAGTARAGRTARTRRPPRARAPCPRT